MFYTWITISSFGLELVLLVDYRKFVFIFIYLDHMSVNLEVLVSLKLPINSLVHDIVVGKCSFASHTKQVMEATQESTSFMRNNIQL